MMECLHAGKKTVYRRYSYKDVRIVKDFKGNLLRNIIRFIIFLKFFERKEFYTYLRLG